jgi:hypothetical protein
MSDAAGAGIGAGVIFFYIIFLALIFGSFWKIFTKADKPGWAGIIPIYNFIVMLEIVGRPLWWIVLSFIPLLNLVFLFVINIDLAKSFGKGAGFGIGISLPGIIFYPVLAFGDAEYQGPSAA